MKIVAVFFLAVVALAAADVSLVDKARSLLDDIEQVPVFLQKARIGGPSLREALGRSDAADLDILEERIRKDLGQSLRQLFEELLKNLQELGDKAQAGLKELLEQLLHKPPTAENVSQFVAQLSAIHDEQTQVGSVVGYALNEHALAATLTSLSARGISDWWETIKEWFAGLGSAIPDKLDAFKEWVKGVFQTAIDASKPLRDQVKELAIEFLKNNWEDLSVKLVKQALDFFTPFDGEIGADVMRKLIELAKKFGIVPGQKHDY